MPEFDLIIRGGLALVTGGVERLDIAITGETIVAVSPSIAGSWRQEISAEGLYIFPGVIDSHVHFNEPGRTDWEGVETGSRALAAGGGTLFFDMPLNAHPPTIDAASFDLKAAAAEQNSVTDFALWGGLVPGNVNSLEELAARGVVGFKAFMSNSGIEDFLSVDDKTLREGMKRAAQLDLPVAVHAESEGITSRLTGQKIAAGKISIRDYLESRPIEAELEAITRAIGIAGETGCALHVVHVSSAAGIELISAAKRNGVNVSCETCPHYLVLDETDVERIGALAKCAPPVRSAAEQEKLWQQLLAGNIDTAGSDHSPSPPAMKKDKNFFKVWGGISGVQHTLPLLLTRIVGSDAQDEDTLKDFHSAAARVSQLLSRNVARRFRLPRSQGPIEVGSNANLSLVEMGHSYEVRSGDLMYRHKQTPYAGRELRAEVRRTLLRGATIFHDGKIVAKPAGRLVKPAR